MRLILLGAAIVHCAGFAISLVPHVHGKRLAVNAVMASDEATRDPSPQTPERITPEGLARIRERQRLQAKGVPMKEWAKLSDREDPRDAVPHIPVPPSKEQAEAANALAEAMLSSNSLPDSFGDGLDDLGMGRIHDASPRV